jgi:hypothetical protein
MGNGLAQFKLAKNRERRDVASKEFAASGTVLNTFGVGKRECAKEEPHPLESLARVLFCWVGRHLDVWHVVAPQFRFRIVSLLDAD